MALIPWNPPNPSAVDWTVGANWVGGTPPVGGDIPLMPKGALSGPTAGVNGLTATQFASIITERGFNFDMGTSVSPLKCSVNKFIHRGGGTVYFEDAGTIDGTLDTNDVIVDSDNLTLAMQLNGSGTQAIDRLTIVKGYVKVASSLGAASIGRIHMHYRTNPQTDAKLLVEAPSGTSRTLPLLIMSGGEATIYQIVTEAVVSGGILTKELEEIVTLMLSGGTVLYNSPKTTGAINGTMTTAIVAGGTLDFDRNYVEKEVTNLTVLRGGTVLRVNGLVNVTNEHDTTGYAMGGVGGGGFG